MHWLISTVHTQQHRARAQQYSAHTQQHYARAHHPFTHASPLLLENIVGGTLNYVQRLVLELSFDEYIPLIIHNYGMYYIRRA